MSHRGGGEGPSPPPLCTLMITIIKTWLYLRKEILDSKAIFEVERVILVQPDVVVVPGGAVHS